MSRPGSVIGAAVRGIVSGIWSFVLWTIWLALGILLVAQLYVYTANELAVPGIVLRRLEDQLAASGIRLTFSRTSFDPTGRILIEDVRAYLPEYAEPVLTAQAIYAELNPWMLAVGLLDARQVRVSGASAFVPAMLSGSGRPEEIIRHLEVTVSPHARQWLVPQLSARVAGIAVSAHGVVPGLLRSRGPQLDPAALIARHFPAVCRQVMDWSERLAVFEEPSIELELGASDAGSLRINATLLAEAARLEAPTPVEARGVRVATRALLLGATATSQIAFDAAEVALPSSGATARRVQGLVVGGLDTSAGFAFEPRQLELTADAISRGRFTLETVSTVVLPRTLPELEASITAHLAGDPLAIRARADLRQQRGDFSLRARIAPALLGLLGEELKVDIRQHFDFEEFELEAADVRMGPQWKFERLSATFELRDALARGVRVDEGRGTLHFDGRHIRAPEVSARIGENHATGSYEHEVATRRFRLLLAGQLRPLDISAIFRPWWASFFRQFEFPDAPPVASVDVNGVWGDGHQAAVFVFAETPRAIIRGGTFTDLQTRLYVRPGFYHGLEVHAASGQGRIDGSFLYTIDWNSRRWRELDLNLRSTVPVDVVTTVIGPASQRFVAPFGLESPPDITLRARFDGPASPAGRHHQVDAVVRTAGELRFHQFPVRDASFSLAIRDDEIAVRELAASFAGGALGGQARVWGAGAERRVGFDLALQDALLGESVATVQGFFARRRGEPPPPPGRFVQEKANVRLQVNASAEGGYGEPFSFRGAGSAVLRGAEIGSVPLLGTLSETLRFTTMRFTEARGVFRIEGRRLQFSEVALRGSNSAIDAHGAYALDTRTLDFNAKVLPFQDSDNLVKSVVGAVLSPISNAMEVKLSGSLEKPEWRFLLLSSLTGPAENGDPAPTEPAPSAGPPPVPPGNNLPDNPLPQPAPIPHR